MGPDGSFGTITTSSVRDKCESISLSLEGSRTCDDGQIPLKR